MADIEISSIAEYRRNESSQGGNSRSNYSTIIWIKTGSCTHFVDFIPIAMQSDDLLFIGPNRLLAYDTSLFNYDGIIIRFTDDFFCRTSSETRFLRDCTVF